MENYRIEDIMSAFMANPGPATGLRWERGRGSTAWQSSQHPDGTEDSQRRRDTLIIKTASDGLPVFYHNGGGNQAWNFWNYFREHFNTNDTHEVICALAECYNIMPDLSGFTPEQRQRYDKRKADAAFLNATAKFLTKELCGTDGEAARRYLLKRKLKPSPRLAAYGRNIKERLIPHLLQTFPGTPAATVEKFVSQALPFYDPDDYQLIIPYYNGTTDKCTGFVGRLTSSKETYVDTATGEEVKKAKYRNSQASIFIKGGYCTAMKHGLPIVIVEGNLDVERLMQAGLDSKYNIFAFGTQTPVGAGDGDLERNQIATLKRYGSKHIIYVPDREFDREGRLRTAATENTIKALAPYINGTEDGFLSLRIADLPNPGQDKMDADSYVVKYGKDAFCEQVERAEDYWMWQLRTAAQELSGAELASRASTIYCGIMTGTDRERVKQLLEDGNAGQTAEALRRCGFTARYLEDMDRWNVSNYIAGMFNQMTASMNSFLDTVNRNSNIQPWNQE